MPCAATWQRFQGSAVWPLCTDGAPLPRQVALSFVNCLHDYTECTGEQQGARVLFYGDSTLRGSWQDLLAELVPGSWATVRAKVVRPLPAIEPYFQRQHLTAGRMVHTFDFLQRVSFGPEHVCSSGRKGTCVGLAPPRHPRTSSSSSCLPLTSAST